MINDAYRNLVGDTIMSDPERGKTLADYAEEVIARSKQTETPTEIYLRIIGDNIARLTAQLQHLEGTVIDNSKQIEIWERIAKSLERRQDYLEFIEGHLEELAALKRENDIEPDDLPGLVDMVKSAVFKASE